MLNSSLCGAAMFRLLKTLMDTDSFSTLDYDGICKLGIGYFARPFSDRAAVEI